MCYFWDLARRAVMSRRAKGFSLVEILFALAIIGIVSAIAIPQLLGSRQQARYTADARSNAAVIHMRLEAIKADTGQYPPAGTFVWAQGVPPAGNPVPAVTDFSRSTKLDFTLDLLTSQTYTITVTDPRDGNRVILVMNQNGQITNP